MNADRKRFSRAFLLLLLAAVSLLFLAMIRDFLVILLLAAVFAGLATPLYRKVRATLRGHRVAASAVTMILLLALVIVPLLLLLGLIAGQALSISEKVGPWIGARMGSPDHLIERIPGIERLDPYRGEIVAKGAELVGTAGTFLFNSLSATTRGTVSFLFQFALFLYAMFFFLIDGDAILRKILYYMPLGDEDEERMVGRFLSVARATIKGTLVIGIAQGTLAGVAFWIAGIQGPLFWGTLMTFLSIIPGIGTALVWLPAAVILLARHALWQGIFLVLFCGAVVGTVDNLLRPRLVGRDTQMHDLLILFSTLGGLMLFGLLGFLIGPIVAALFVTVWDIYGHLFRDYLPGGSGGRPPAGE